MAGGLGQTGRTSGRHGMVARFARQRHQTRIDPPLAQKAAQHLVAVVLQQAAGRRETLAGMVRTGARAVGTEKKDVLAAYALPQAQAAAVGQAPAHPETQKQRPGMVEQGRMPRGEYGGPGGSGQGIGQKTRIAGDAGAKDARRQGKLRDDVCHGCHDGVGCRPPPGQHHGISGARRTEAGATCKKIRPAPGPACGHHPAAR